MSIIWTEPRKISDILGGNLVDIPTRTCKLASGQGALDIGTLLIADASDVYYVCSAADLPTRNVSIGVLGQLIDTGEIAVTGTFEVAAVFFGGEFIADQLITLEVDPVDVRSIREHLLLHNLYLQG